MRHFSAIFFLALLIVFPSCNKIRERGLFGKKAKTLEILKAQQDSIRIADSLKKVQNRLSAAEEAHLDSLIQAEEERMSFEARNKYNIVVGSFITPEYAKAWAEEFRKKGYDARIIRMTNSRYELVVAESYELLSKAVGRLNQLYDTDGIEAWLYEKK